jgi:hypothetical protein
MFNWTVDGTNQLNQQWFWYRIGSTGTQTSINNLNQPTGPVLLDTNGDGKNDYAQLSYEDAAKSFTVSVTYSLTGGNLGSKTSDIGETIKVTNISSASLSYHFFEYSDFNLGGLTGGENVAISPLTGANTATVTQTTGGELAQTVVSPKSSLYEAGSFPNLLNALNTTTDLTLNDTATASNTDAEWAYEWDAVLNPGASLLISVDNQVRSVPEPTSAVSLAGLGGLFFARPRRRDEDPDPRMAQVAQA